MRAKKAWLVQRETLGANCAPVLEPLCVVVPSKRVTNKAVEDLTYAQYANDLGELAITSHRVHWVTDADDLVWTPEPGRYHKYRLSPIQVYG